MTISERPSPSTSATIDASVPVKEVVRPAKRMPPVWPS
jgi:hypothetical protein